MRIRTIKPEFFLHEGLFEAEKETKLPLRIAFAGMWCAADREGRFKWEPRKLGIQILPYDGVDFSRVLDALATRGFIVRYACLTGDCGVIPSFLRHQVINNRERESELPEPSQTLINQAIDASSTREPRDEHAGKAEGKGREQGKEGNKDGKGFDEFWQSYPNKTGKANALKVWNRDKPNLQTVLDALSWQKRSEAWTKDGGQFIPHASTYLNGKRYEDEKPKPKPQTSCLGPTGPWPKGHSFL